jgi:arylsulfatase
MDNGSPVSEDYEPPFAYTGIIKKVEINIQPSSLNTSDQQKIEDAERAAASAIE